MPSTTIESDVAQHFFTGRATVGQTPVRIGNGQTMTRGLQVLADEFNTGIVYIGRSDCTPGNDTAKDGFPLSAGKGLFIPVEKIDQIHAVSTVDNQKLWFMGV